MDPFDWWYRNGQLVFFQGDVRIFNVEGEDYLFIGQTIYASSKERLWYGRNVYPYAKGRVLEIGLGLGCASQILCRAPKIQHLFTIEKNEHVIQAFGRPLPNHHILHADVNDWIELVPPGFSFYDLIFVDHYVMGDEELYPQLENLAGRLEALLNPGGRMIFWIDENASEEEQEKVRKLWLEK